MSTHPEASSSAGPARRAFLKTLGAGAAGLAGVPLPLLLQRQFVAGLTLGSSKG